MIITQDMVLHLAERALRASSPDDVDRGMRELITYLDRGDDRYYEASLSIAQGKPEPRPDPFPELAMRAISACFPDKAEGVEHALRYQREIFCLRGDDIPPGNWRFAPKTRFLSGGKSRIEQIIWKMVMGERKPSEGRYTCQLHLKKRRDGWYWIVGRGRREEQHGLPGTWRILEQGRCDDIDEAAAAAVEAASIWVTKDAPIVRR